MKDHGDGLGRLGRDVAGVAQRPEILPGAVAVVELLLGGLEGRKARGGPVLQLLPPGHADGPSSAFSGDSLDLTLDLTEKAGQSRDLRTKVVGLDNLNIFVAGKNSDLGAGSAGLRCRCQAGSAAGGFYARQNQECGALGIEASDAGQECDARKHKWHLCF